MKQFKAFAAVAAVAASSFAASPLFAETELIFNSYLPKMNPAYKAGIEGYANKVAEISGGELIITIPDMSMAPSDQQYELLIDGVADIAWLPTDDMSQLVVFSAIADLPYNAPTPKAASIAMWETYKKYFEQYGEYEGVKVLSMNALGGRQPMGMAAQVDQANSMEGQKVWVPNGPMTDIVEAMGGIPVHVNFPQLFEAVSKGQIDMLVASPGAALASGIKDMVNYQTIVPGGLGSVSFATAISLESWANLTEQEQNWLLEAAEGLAATTGGATTGLEFAGMKAMPHMETVQASPEMLARITPLMDAQVEAWKEAARAKGLDNVDEVLEFYQSVLARETANN